MQRLEDDIERLRRLDEIRNKAYKLRDDGYSALLRAHKLRNEKKAREELNHDDRNLMDAWQEEEMEPHDRIQPAIKYMVATARFAMDDIEKAKRNSNENRLSMSNDFRNAQLTNLTSTDLEEFFAITGDHPLPSGLGVPHRSRVELFQAARVFQALVRTPDSIFSRTSMLAYYRLVRELYAIDPPNWMIGGARATAGGYPSAFMTGECCRSISLFSRAINDTSRFIEVFVKRYTSFLKLYSDQASPMAWQLTEIKRQTLATYNVINALKRNAIVNFPEEELTELVIHSNTHVAASNFKSWIEDHHRILKEVMTKFIENMLRIFRSATRDCETALKATTSKYRSEKTSLQNAEKPGRLARVRLAHMTGSSAIESVNEIVAIGIGVFEDLGETLKSGEIDSDARNKLNVFLERLLVYSSQITRVFSPAKAFVEGVLDKEIENGESGNENLGELVFAVSTYLSISNPNVDTRVDRAITIVANRLAEGKRIKTPGHLDTDSHGYSLMLVLSEVHKALALVLDNSETQVPIELFERIIEYFERTAVRIPHDGKLKGWSHDIPRHPRKVASWTTGLALLGLDRIGRMLDERINRRVYKHFTVRHPSMLKSNSPSLSRLYYPDHGNTAIENARMPKEARGQSVSLFMERMRSHIHGIFKPPSYSKECYATIFYGPPGTGKTTLVEALSYSCRVPLIEITTSDFLIEGEAFIERRARVVFEALSFLTKSVVMFDEFDPMVKARGTESQLASRNVFSFLTPGLLPKLKNLNGRAKENRVVMCLLTNKIGELDDAAIRNGRFDFKVGVFPPDVHSRTGYFLKTLKRQEQELERSLTPSEISRSLRAIVGTAGSGMTYLCQKGNLRNGMPEDDSMLGFVLHGDGQFDAGVPDAIFPAHAPDEKDDQWLLYEYDQWEEIKEWDEKLTHFVSNNPDATLDDFVNEVNLATSTTKKPTRKTDPPKNA